MHGAWLRKTRTRQEPLLGPPPALAYGRQARPSPVHGVHQPGLGRQPAAARLRGPRLRLLPLRARSVPAAPSAMGKGRPTWHQRLGGRTGLRSALAAAGCLRGPRLRPVGDAGRAVLPYPLPGLAAGRPGPGEFAAARADPGLGCEWIDVRCLPGRLRLEIQYVLQCRGDDRQSRLRPVTVQQILRDLAATGAVSLLERTEEQWAEPGPRGIRARGGRQFTRDARARIEQLAFGSGWEVEYPRDKWRLRNLGIQPGKEVAAIDFAPIGQPWLAGLAKRWCRWRLSAGLSAGEAAQGVRVLRRFSAFLAAHAPGAGLASIDRPLLERYLADLSASSLSPSSRQGHVSALNGFLRDIRRHDWDDGSLPAAAVFYHEDYPKLGQRLPRAVAAHVMAQVEDPANLDRWGNPAYRLITVILIRCGLRISSAVTLAWDCVVTDAAGAPYLRYCNTKMKREALVPIDDELRAMISAQHDRVRLQRPDGTPVLFPRPQTNLAGTRPVGGSTYRGALYCWLADCDIRDEHGQPVHLTPHQWRHTLGTVLINRDVPQHVVQKILDHDSPLMTAHYARLSDKTVREHWERASKVNASGQPVQLSPDGPLGDAAWAKQQLSRATQALPNGYCQLPLVKTCPHANSCFSELTV